jgi:hypothetical protein
MRAVLPGKPESRLQALCTGYWDGRQITVRLFCPLLQRLVRTVGERLEDPQKLIASTWLVLYHRECVRNTQQSDNPCPDCVRW